MKQVVKDDGNQEKSGGVFLIHAVDEVHAQAVESLLRSYDIPVLKRRSQAGDYLNIATGINIYGVDIYVPSKLHKAANALIKSKKEYGGHDAELLQEEEVFRRKRLVKIWIIIGIFYLPVLIWLLVGLFR
ncbi:MAG: hypothetical protein GX144_04515 [Clostridiaceae bacterium]|jgi:hypothetical protein|nr:hypothetical protein [Clostridiaceae bacterium]